MRLYVGPTAEREAETRSVPAFGEPKLRYQSVNQVNSEQFLYRITNSRKYKLKYIRVVLKKTEPR